METAQRVIEVERLVNIAKGFGWSLTSSSTSGDTLKVELQKTVGPSASETAPKT
jgi:hypothetical protein